MHPNFNDGMTTKVRLALVSDGLKEIFRRFREDVDPPVFELRDNCIQMLRSVKLLKLRRYTSNQVGVHPKNRYGDGIIPGHVVSLVEKFTLRGFSEEDLGIPRATELPPPGHARREEFVRFCNLLAEKSGGILPMYGANEIEIVSGQKSHTSQACRCVLQGAACENELIAADGRCSLEKVRAQRPSFAKVCEEGMEWEVVPWEVEDEFDLIMDLIQETGNAATTTAQQETRLEICLKMTSSFNRSTSLRNNMTDTETDEVWTKVIQEARRGGSDFADEIPDLANFLKNSKTEQLHELVDFQKSLSFNPRIVNASIMHQVMKVPLGEDGLGHQDLKMDHNC